MSTDEEAVEKMLNKITPFDASPKENKAEAERLVAALQADKKSTRFQQLKRSRALMIKPTVNYSSGAWSLRIPGVTCKFVETLVRQHREDSGREQRETAERVHRSNLRALAKPSTVLNCSMAFAASSAIRCALERTIPPRLIALWIIHTHVFQILEFTPYLEIARKTERQKPASRSSRGTGCQSVADPEGSARRSFIETDAALGGDPHTGEALRGVFDTVSTRAANHLPASARGGMSYHDFSTFSSESARWHRQAAGHGVKSIVSGSIKLKATAG